MLILSADKSVQMCDIEAMWYHENSYSAPTLLYDPTRSGDSISRYYAGRQEQSGAEVVTLAKTILDEQ